MQLYYQLVKVAQRKAIGLANSSKIFRIEKNSKWRLRHEG